MSGVELPAALPWLSFALSWVALGLLATLVHALLLRALGHLPAVQRESVLFRLALLPPIAATISVILGYAPAIGGVVVDPHCHETTGCSTHVPVLHAGLLQAGGWIAAIVALSVAIGWAILRRVDRSMAYGRMLEAIAEDAAEPGSQRDLARAAHRTRRPHVRVVESERAFAWCTGLLWPRVIASTALRNSLPADEFEAVIAHEFAHAERHDNLRRLLAAISLWPVPRRWRLARLADLTAAGEAACDQAAARVIGDPRALVRAIERLRSGGAPASGRPGAGFAAHGDDRRGADAERLRALAVPPAGGLRGWFLNVATIGGYAAVSLLTTLGTHHAVELLFG